MTLAALMREAAGAVDAGDLERAEPLLAQIVGLNPRDAEAWHMLAVIALRAGRADVAVERATRAHERDRRNALYLNTLGVAHGEAGRLDDAARWFRRALKERPGHAESHYNLGKALEKLGQADEAERSYLRARQLDPERADVANNLAVLHARRGNYAKALPFLAEASAGLPDDTAVAINCAFARLATAGPDAAIAELRSFLQRHPGAAPVRAELGRRLLAEGRFAEGWQEYSWRRADRVERLPDDLRGRRVLLLPDQGLGDHLFFLRFAPALRDRGASVAFACPEKLLPVLEGNDAVAELRATDEVDLSIPLGDLPRLLGASDTPPPVRLAPARIAQWRERLAALGPAPYLGVTWRGGVTGRIDRELGARGEDPLQKEIGPEMLAAALKGWPGSVLILQRSPEKDELARFSKSIGKGVHDLSGLNEDLADMVAALALIDEYVGVSNTNMHLRAGVQKTARVLVPFPPEFRWMHRDAEVPWFPGFRIYRQSAARDWTAPLEVLRQELRL